MQDPLKEYYDVLGLPPAASRDEVKRAWRDLCKVWHPDRFEGDLPLQERAEEKLRAVSAAYEALRNIAPPGTQLTIVESPLDIAHKAGGVVPETEPPKTELDLHVERQRVKLESQRAEVEVELKRNAAERERLEEEAERTHRLGVVVAAITFPFGFFFTKYAFELNKKVLIKKKGVLFFGPVRTFNYVNWGQVCLFTAIFCWGNYIVGREGPMRNVLWCNVIYVMVLLLIKWLRASS